MSSKISSAVSGPTRRQFILSSTTLTAASLLASPSSIAASHSGPRHTIEIPGTDELVPELMPTGFSISEIERRWNKCREWMRREDLDALIVPVRADSNADVKWFTESSPNWVVFPQQGRPVAIFRTSDEANAYRDSSDLDILVLDSRFERSRVVIESLKNAGVTNGKIGVGDFAGTMRNDEGGVSYLAMVRIMDALPDIRFVSAVDLLMRIKLVRGPEEIEVLKLGSRVSELGLKAMVEASAAGVPHRDVWYQVYKALLDATGEVPGRVSIRAGGEGNTADGKPLRELLKAGQILSEEISGSLLGYNSQVNQAVCIGPAPAQWQSTFSYNLELFEELVQWAKPGRSFADYSAFYKQKVDERMAVYGGENYFGVVFHTAGAHGDGPRMGWGRDDENSDLIIEPGMVFTIKPRVPIPGVESPTCQIGDAVLITDTGAVRLGRRKLEPITV